MTNDVLNLARLVEAFEDDAVSIANLLELARDSEKRYIQALRDAINQADLEAVAQAAHSIKGSASNIGAGKVSAVAANIEDLARVHVWEGIAALADELDDVYVTLCERISDYALKLT